MITFLLPLALFNIPLIENDKKIQNELNNKAVYSYIKSTVHKKNDIIVFDNN